MRSGGHFPAAFGAPAAGIDAFLHVADLLAALGALLADFSADRAGALVKIAAHQHEVCRGLADLGAGYHEPEMLRLDMPSACLQAMVHGHAEADAVAALAFVDAALHFSGHLVHVASPLRKRRKQEAASAAPVSPHRGRKVKTSRSLTAIRPSEAWEWAPTSSIRLGASLPMERDQIR